MKDAEIAAKKLDPDSSSAAAIPHGGAEAAVGTSTAAASSPMAGAPLEDVTLTVGEWFVRNGACPPADRDGPNAAFASGGVSSISDVRDLLLARGGLTSVILIFQNVVGMNLARQSTVRKSFNMLSEGLKGAK